MTKRVVGLIPARGGSKGLPGKNIKLICGKPLIYWTIKAAQDSNYITEAFVTSDSEEILSFSKKSGAKLIKRPAELSSDDTLMRPVLLHAIDFLKLNGEDIIVLLQPTSPLRGSEDIDEALKKFSDKLLNGMISVVKEESGVLKYLWLDDGELKPLIDTDTPFKRRQELPLVYKPNGAIYIWKVKPLLQELGLWVKPMGHFEMTELKSIDIDTIDDLQEAEVMMKSELRTKDEEKD